MKNIKVEASFTPVKKVIPAQEAHKESFLLEREFMGFMNKIKDLNAQSEKINGSMKEFLTLNQMNRAYKESFENVAMAENTIQYRAGKINPNEFPNDFMVLEHREAGEPKYYINRKNEELLKRLYAPKITGDSEFEETIKNVQTLEDTLNTQRNLSEGNF